MLLSLLTSSLSGTPSGSGAETAVRLSGRKGLFPVNMKVLRRFPASSGDFDNPVFTLELRILSSQEELTLASDIYESPGELQNEQK